MIVSETGHFMRESALGDIKHVSWFFKFLQWPFKFTSLGEFMNLSLQSFLTLTFLQLGINYILQKTHNVVLLSFNIFTDFYYEYWGCGLLFILKHFIFKRMKVRVCVNLLNVCQDRCIMLLCYICLLYYLIFSIFILMKKLELFSFLLSIEKQLYGQFSQLKEFCQNKQIKTPCGQFFQVLTLVSTMKIL